MKSSGMSGEKLSNKLVVPAGARADFMPIAYPKKL